jgi:hypothetical protein
MKEHEFVFSKSIIGKILLKGSDHFIDTLFTGSIIKQGKSWINDLSLIDRKMLRTSFLISCTLHWDRITTLKYKQFCINTSITALAMCEVLERLQKTSTEHQILAEHEHKHLACSSLSITNLNYFLLLLNALTFILLNQCKFCPFLRTYHGLSQWRIASIDYFWFIILDSHVQ